MSYEKEINDAFGKHGCLPGEKRLEWFERKMARLRELEHIIAPTDLGKSYVIEHDGFAGMVIGGYVTHEGKEGVVLQQHGTKVVHVYGRKWLK